METIKEGLFSLTKNDWIKGLVSAVIGGAAGAFLTTVGGVIGTPGFNLFLTDWGTVLSNAINIAFICGYGAFTGYIGKNFLSNSKGEIPTPLGTIAKEKK